jgi:beta-galactosidase GanA
VKVSFGGDDNSGQWDRDVWEDAIVGRAVAGGRRICLATGTGAHPPWLARRFPEVYPTDFEGRRHRFGQRHDSGPSSPVFRRLSAELARRVARRYAGHETVVAWVIRPVLAEQGLSGPYPDVPDLEATTRVAPDGTRLRFVLNHRAEPVEVPAPAGGLDLLTGDRIRAGQPRRLAPRDVVVIAEEP